MTFHIVLYQVLIIFILMATGYLITKVGIINGDVCKGISRLLLLVVSPVLIVISFQTKISASLVRGLLISAASAIATHMLAIILGYLIFNKRSVDDAHRSLLRFGVVYSNCGFIGIPLLGAVIGKRGIFYASVYIVVFSAFIWTHGVSVLTSRTDKKWLLKLVLNPNIIAVAIGLLLFSFSVTLPPLISDSMQYIFNLNTPLAMIVIGSSMAQIDLRTIAGDRHVWPGIAVKNLLLPFIALFLLHLAGVTGELLLACLIPIACPVAGSVVLFPDMYGMDTRFASKLMTLSTLFSVVTIPLLVYIISVLKY